MSPKKAAPQSKFDPQGGGIMYVIQQSEVNIVYRRVSKLKLLLRYTLQRGIYELLAGIIGFNLAHLRANDLIALAGTAHHPVIAVEQQKEAEQNLLSQKNSSIR